MKQAQAVVPFSIAYPKKLPPNIDLVDILIRGPMRLTSSPEIYGIAIDFNPPVNYLFTIDESFDNNLGTGRVENTTLPIFGEKLIIKGKNSMGI